jgi:hypothetical protein
MFSETGLKWRQNVAVQTGQPASLARAFGLGQAPGDGLCSISSIKRIGPSPPYGEEAMSLDPVLLNPLIALIAGILILLMPRLLNYVVAIYLIAIGIIGLANHLQ